MKSTLTYLALLLVALLLAACGTQLTQPSGVPRPEFKPVQQLQPEFYPFTGDTGAAPQAEFPSVWFVELDLPSGVDIGLQAATASVSRSLSALQAEAAAQGVTFTPRFTFSTFISGFSAELDPNELLTVANLPGVTRIMPVAIIEPPEVLRHDPSEILPLDFRALAMTGADVVHRDLGFTGAGIRVGIIDSGILLNHPAFGGRVRYGFDFVGDFYNAADPAFDTPVPQPGPGTRPGGGDCMGHGTHVAGIVGASPGAGVVGVAPGVTLGSYRVFGCAGSTHTDVILAAIERAFADRMDIVNLSLGAGRGWPQDFLSVALSRMLDFGVIPVASAGNDGADGIFAIGSPAAGRNVISVASFDNTHTQRNFFDVAGRSVGYAAMGGSVAVPTTGTGEVVYIGRACPGDPLLADPTGRIALVIRGACSFAAKATRAEAAGATAVVIHNHLPGFFAGFVGAGIGVPVVSIALEDGEFIRAQTAPVMLTWREGTIDVPIPTASLISTFSSYGLAPDLTLKPVIGAPGGFINSTYILDAVPGEPASGRPAFAVASGTSMSSPHVAGAAALLLQARPELQRNRVRDLLMNTAVPQRWNLAPGEAWALDSVHRQGAGMLQIDNAILNRNFAVPAKLSLGESASGPFVEVITIHNQTTSEITYDLTTIEALGLLPVATHGDTNRPSFAVAPPLVEYFGLGDRDFLSPITHITVPAGSLASFQVRVMANPAAPDGTVYGTYLLFSPRAPLPSGALPILVPAAGFKGDYQQLPVFTFPPFLAAVDDAGRIRVLPEGTAFTMRGGDVPTFGVGMAHGAQRVVAELVPLGARSWIGPQPGFEVELFRRNRPGTVYLFGLGDFDASTLPDGQYMIRFSVLRALGDPTNPGHVVIAETPSFFINRSTPR